MKYRKKVLTSEIEQRLVEILKETASEKEFIVHQAEVGEQDPIHVFVSAHPKVANQRKDFQHKWSKTLTDENQIICIEDLNVHGMIKNRKLAKHIADAAWYQFRTFLTYKALRKGRTLVVIDRFFASSKLCSSCNTKKGGLTLNERTWICPSCGKKHDRDENASLNIEKEGLRILGA